MTTPWGERAARLYGDDYARRYRQADDEIRAGALVARFGGWLRDLCDSFGRDIVVLDLGCGTGRYFGALHHVRELVGIDVSAPMLAEARRPVDADAVRAGSVTLIQGDFLNHAFEPGRFDLVYSVGVLAEHSPFDARVADAVHGWLAPGGVFAFTTVHPLSFSVPRTLKRRIGEALLPISAGPLRRALRDRLMADGLYADEERIGEVLGAAGFAVEALDRYENDVHVHCLATARKAGGRP